MSQVNPSEQEINTYAQEWLSNGNKIKAAWKVVFPDSQATEKSKDEKSSILHNLIKVQSRISDLSGIAAKKANERFGITAESLLGEYEDIRDRALSDAQYGAAVSAVNGKVKLCGFEVGKLEVTGANGEKLLPDSIKVTYE